MSPYRNTLWAPREQERESVLGTLLQIYGLGPARFLHATALRLPPVECQSPPPCGLQQRVGQADRAACLSSSRQGQGWRTRGVHAAGRWQRTAMIAPALPPAPRRLAKTPFALRGPRMLDKGSASCVPGGRGATVRSLLLQELLQDRQQMKMWKEGVRTESRTQQ